jgi:hypothetical protein
MAHIGRFRKIDEIQGELDQEFKQRTAPAGFRPKI